MKINRNQFDRNIWCFRNDRGFTTISFSDEVLKLQNRDVDSFKFAAKAWYKMAPPKVEMLVWFLLLGKLNTKDRLVNLNILPRSKANCVLCNEHMENIGHLFFSCNYSWKLWCSYFNKLKINWVILVDPRIAFESWLEVDLSRIHRKEWCVCFFSMIWLVWEARKKIIFQKEAFPVEKCLALLWHRWQVWTKEWC